MNSNATDWELLQAWVSRNDESAFEELVHRYLGLVYAAARRQVGRDSLAEDVTQAVFQLLASKADSLNEKVVLAGWLFRSTRYVAARALRAERRRTNHELAAAMEFIPAELPPASDRWKDVEPHLDEALSALTVADRDAVMLRFFLGKQLGEVGAHLGITEQAAKKRVSRAVDRLRFFFERHGVVLTVGTLLTLLTQLPTSGAPVGLAARVVEGVTTHSASQAVRSLSAGAAADWLVSRLLSLAPWLTAAVLVIALATVGKFQTGARDERTLVASKNAGINPTPESTRAVPGPSRVPSQKVVSRLLLNIRSKRTHLPLIARVLNHSTQLDVQSDTNGIVEIPISAPVPQWLSLWISAPGHVPIASQWMAHEFTEPVLVHDIRLEPGRRMEGLVRDEGGQPIVGAEIHFTPLNSAAGQRETVSFFPQADRLLSDEAGRFSSDQLPSISRNGGGLGFVVTHPEFVSARVFLNDPEALRTNQVVILKRGGYVVGRVVGATDEPISNVSVKERDEFWGSHRKTSSSAEGRFAVGPFAFGSILLEFQSAGFKPTRVRLDVGKTAEESLVRLEPLEPDNPSSDLEPNPAKQVRLAGSVLDAESGAPVEHFAVRLLDESRKPQRFLGGGNSGFFDWVVQLPPMEQFALEVESEGFEPVSSDVREMKADLEEFGFRLHRQASIEGRVIDPLGRPVADATVGLQGLDFGLTLMDDTLLSSADAPLATTDSEGHYAFRSKSNVELLVAVHPSGIGMVPIMPGQTGEIVLKPWGSIRGRVVGPSGPRSRQGVVVRSWIPEADSEPFPITFEESMDTDAQGGFRFNHVPPGTVALSRFYSPTSSAIGGVGAGPRTRVEVPPGGIVAIELGPRGRRVTGRVQLSHPIAGLTRSQLLPTLEALPTPFETPSTGFPATSGALWSRRRARYEAQVQRYFPIIRQDGLFEIADVPAGDYVFKMPHAGTDLLSATTSRSGDNRAPQRFDFQELQVSVPDGDENDKPVDLGTIAVKVNDP